MSLSIHHPNRSLRWVVLFVTLLAPSFVLAAKPRPVDIQAFPSILRADGTWTIKGRVMRKSRWLREDANPGKLRSFMGMVRRFTRKSASKVLLRLALGNLNIETNADEKGYFRFDGQLPTSRPTSSTTSSTTQPSCQKPQFSARTTPYPISAGIYPFTISMPPQKDRKGRPYQSSPFQGFLVHRSGSKGLHLISDLDDTLIWTYVTKKTKLLKQALFNNVNAVKTIEGALPFLQQVLCQPNGQGSGTLHYLSGSPTRLFDRVMRIFQLHGFPLGSLTLRPLSSKSASQGQQSLYKVREIQRILQAYPNERFILLGDNGEKDPVIYNLIRNQYPQRISAILIHQIKPLTLEQQALANTFYFKKYQDASKYLSQISSAPSRAPQK
ncbi:MAG: App1 family protein [Myxococcales bacterium]|nr:App1 family protein [Myxococcales bacterium]